KVSHRVNQMIKSPECKFTFCQPPATSHQPPATSHQPQNANLRRRIYQQLSTKISQADTNLKFEVCLFING
ncbi:hypothetical protein ACY3W1_004978, partial [Escherichia coli]